MKNNLATKNIIMYFKNHPKTDILNGRITSLNFGKSSWKDSIEFSSLSLIVAKILDLIIFVNRILDRLFLKKNKNSEIIKIKTIIIM